MMINDEIDICDVRTVARIAALLDLDPGAAEPGRALPRGWHFAFFLAAERQSRLSSDGFSPPPSVQGIELTGQAVMLGGRTSSFGPDLQIGAPMRRTRRVLSIAPKEGRSGPLTIVTYENRIFVEGRREPAIIEIENMIYRPKNRGISNSTGQAAPSQEEASARIVVTPTETQLLRYSALTFNAHRIHYDRHYAVTVEGFPDLVVNGGLTALLMLQLFREMAQREAALITTRNLAPAFCNRPMMIEAFDRGSQWSLQALNDRRKLIAVMDIR